MIIDWEILGLSQYLDAGEISVSQVLVDEVGVNRLSPMPCSLGRALVTITARYRNLAFVFLAFRVS